MCVVGVIRIYNADGQVKNISNHPNRKSKIGIVRYDYGLLEISCVSVNEKICSEVDIGAFFFDCVNFDEFSNAASRRYQWARDGALPEHTKMLLKSRRRLQCAQIGLLTTKLIRITRAWRYMGRKESHLVYVVGWKKNFTELSQVKPLVGRTLYRSVVKIVPVNVYVGFQGPTKHRDRLAAVSTLSAKWQGKFHE